MNVKVTITKDRDGYEYRLIIEKDGYVIMNKYFDPCEPYIYPSDIVKVLKDLGVGFELVYKNS